MLMRLPKWDWLVYIMIGKYKLVLRLISYCIHTHSQACILLISWGVLKVGQL